MASVHRDLSYRDGKPRSPYWYGVYTGPDGRRVKKSTKCRDRTRALDVVKGWAEAARLAKESELIEDQARKVLNQMLAGAGAQPISAVTVRCHFDDVIGSKSHSLSKGSLDKYRRIARDFLAMLGPKADKRMELVTSRDVQAFLDQELRGGRTPVTVNQSLKILRVFFGKARRLGLISNSPADAVESLRGVGRERGTFTREQIALLLENADIEWRGLILVGVFTGMRLGDASRLTWANVDLENRLLAFSPRKAGGKQHLKVPLAPEVFDYLATLPTPDNRPNAPLFPRLSKTSVGAKSGLSQQFLRMVRGIGIDPHDGQEKAPRQPGKPTVARRTPIYCFHSLRHSFVSALAAANVPEEIRCQLSGHKSKTVHAQYTHHQLETLRRAVERLPRIAQ